MKIKQISLFAENKPGHISGPVRLLAENGVDLRALHLADSENYGILRMIVSDSEKGARVLEENGYTVKVNEVLAVEVSDHPGGLADVLDALDGSQINIEYLYAFPNTCKDKAVLIMRFGNIDAAIEQLQSTGVNVLAGAELLKS
jgi:hypothetical protein